MSRVVVIGGGPGGLAVAARLADLRHDVTVLERQKRLGGAFAPVNVGGHLLDPLPATFTLPAVYRDLFRTTGRPMEKILDLQPVDPSARYVIAEGQPVDVPNASRGRTMAQFDAAFGSGAGAAWDAVLRDGERAWAALRTTVLETPGTSRRLADLRRRITDRGRMRTLEAYTTHALPEPTLRAALAYSALRAGLDPRQAPATAALLAYLEHTFGAWQVEGGTHRLIDAIAARAEERGATLRTGAAVQQIEVAGRRITGVRLDGGERIAADVIVSDTAIEPLLTHQRAVEERRWPRPRGRHSRHGPATLSLFLALDDTAPPLPLRTLVMPRQPAHAITEVFDIPAAGLPTDPWIEIDAYRQDVTASDVIAATWAVHVTVPRHGHDEAPGTTDWTAERRSQLSDGVLAALSERGIDARNSVVAQSLRTPADVEAATASIGGATGGTVVYGRGGGVLGSWPRRPPLPTGLEGLYRVGWSAHPGGGLAFTGMGARTVAELIGRA